MRIHLDNEGNEMDKPASIGPCQSLEERMGGATAERVIAGPLTPEFKAILEAPQAMDRREFDYLIQSGQGFGVAYAKAAAAASTPSGSTFHKMFSAGSLSKRTPFSKVDEAKREVWGIVTEQKPDKDGEVCDFEKSLPFYQEWVDQFKKATGGESFGNLREMHQLSAVGRGIAFDPRPKDKQIWMGFKIVDAAAWEKVMQRVYTGFSHGGEKVGSMTADPEFPGCLRYVAKPSEVSLVDNPCLGSATYTLVRADGRAEIVKIH
jgi:hypothetical protein